MTQAQAMQNNMHFLDYPFIVTENTVWKDLWLATNNRQTNRWTWAFLLILHPTILKWLKSLQECSMLMKRLPHSTTNLLVILMVKQLAMQGRKYEMTALNISRLDTIWNYLEGLLDQSQTVAGLFSLLAYPSESESYFVEHILKPWDPFSPWRYRFYSEDPLPLMSTIYVRWWCNGHHSGLWWTVYLWRQTKQPARRVDFLQLPLSKL